MRGDLIWHPASAKVAWIPSGKRRRASIAHLAVILETKTLLCSGSNVSLIILGPGSSSVRPLVLVSIDVGALGLCDRALSATPTLTPTPREVGRRFQPSIEFSHSTIDCSELQSRI